MLRPAADQGGRHRAGDLQRLQDEPSRLAVSSPGSCFPPAAKILDNNKKINKGSSPRPSTKPATPVAAETHHEGLAAPAGFGVGSWHFCQRQALNTVVSAGGSCPPPAPSQPGRPGCRRFACRAPPCLSSRFVLHREKHFHYLKRGLRQLTEAYEVPAMPAVLPAFCSALRLGQTLRSRGRCRSRHWAFAGPNSITASPGAEVPNVPLGHIRPCGDALGQQQQLGALRGCLLPVPSAARALPAPARAPSSPTAPRPP